MFATRAVLLLSMLGCACTAGNSNIGAGGGSAQGGAGGSGGGNGGSGGGGGGGAGTGGGSPGAGGGSGYAADSFFTQCQGVTTVLKGTALAPNGTDPVSGAEITVLAAIPAALTHGVFCEMCNAGSTSGALATVIAGIDGKFTLALDPLTKRSTLVVAIRKAGFRRVLAAVPVTACASTTLDATQTHLPRNATEGDVPKIAISSGNKDHLEKVVAAMGITDADCVKGLPAGSSTETCTSPTTLGQLLGSLDAMKQYGMIFIACAPFDTYEPTASTAAVAQNLKAWVGLGGKLIVTDDSYDFVEQAFPDAIDFGGTSAVAGAAQPANTAEIGTAAASLTGTVADANLVGWLGLFPGAIANSQVTISGFLSKWAVQRQAGTGSSVIVHGTASYVGGSGDVPLTTRFEVGGCGRVIYSSYHTDSGAASLLPQERILEYLMFEVGTCVTIN